MAKKRRASDAETFSALCQVGDAFRQQYSIVRYATYICHTGNRWQKIERWERYDDATEQWLEIRDTLFLHSTPTAKRDG